MRYLVILKDGTILCNVAEADRAIYICRKYAGSTLTTTAWNLLFRSEQLQKMHTGFALECIRYNWTEQETAEWVEERKRWLRSPIYGHQ